MADISGTPPRPARKRRRPAVVCAECRRRKIACDRKTPCGQCALHNVECVYVTGAAPPPYGRALRAPISPGSQPGLVVPGVRNDLATGNVGGSGGGGGGSSSRSSTIPVTGATATAAAAAAAASPPGATAVAGSTTTSPLDEDEQALPPGDELTNTIVSLGERSSRFGGRLAKTRLFGRTHWMNNMDEFKDIHSLTHLVHFVKGSVIYKSMRTCKQIARVIKAAELRRIAAVPPHKQGEPPWLEVPPRAVADRLVALYFNVFEPQFRILHMPTFGREYDAFMAGVEKEKNDRLGQEPGQEQAHATPAQQLETDAGRPAHTTPKHGQGSASADFMIKLVLVLALGSCFYDGEADGEATAKNGENESGPATATAAAVAAAALHDGLRIAAARAVQRMDAAYCAPLDKHRLNLDTLQIYCLVTLARQTTALDIGDDLTWFTTGGLLHTAFGMGLNRDPSHFKSLSFAQAEMRRRLWATILELVVQSSLDQGMPPLISTDDYDCAPPLNLDDDAFGMEGVESRGDDYVSMDLPMHGLPLPGAGAGFGPGGGEKGGGGGAGGGWGGPVPTEGEAGFRRPAPPRSKGHPDTIFTQTSMQRLLYRSLPIRLKITKSLNGLGTGLTYERALQLSADLLEACRYAATTLRAAPLMVPAIGRTSGGGGGTEEKERAAFAKLRIAFYEVLTRRFHHSLHSPFARKAGNNVQFFYSRRARIETVLRLLSFFRQPTSMLADFNTPIASDATPPETEEASSGGIPLSLLQPTAAEDPCRRLWLIGRGMLKCTMIDIKATAIIEMIHQLQEDYVPGSDLTLSQRELYDTVRTIIELSHARLEAGETNVKGYLFFRGALAQVDALMQGKPVRMVIIEAAQAASTKTINTLKNLAARRGVTLPDSLGGGDGDGLDPPSISPVTLQTDELVVGGKGPAAPAGGGAVYTARLNNVTNNRNRNSNSNRNSNTQNNNTQNNNMLNGNTQHGLQYNTSTSTMGPSQSQILGMGEMGSITLRELEKSATTGAGMDTHMMGGSGVSGADVDSAIHLLSATDPSSNTSPDGVAWGVDEWLMDPQGDDLGLGNWFFPYNDRINNS